MGQSCPKKVTNINTLDQLADNQRWGSERGGEDRRKNSHSYFQKIIIITIMYVPHNKLKVFME